MKTVSANGLKVVSVSLDTGNTSVEVEADLKPAIFYLENEIEELEHELENLGVEL
ncbi:MAG: hypothetical protein LBH98_00645 [Chitinispirillales bacterium]|nr:hypothetical protein [Chitinispirillales bacterium]